MYTSVIEVNILHGIYYTKIRYTAIVWNHEKLGSEVKEILLFFNLIINSSPGNKQLRLLSYFQRLPRGEQKS